MHVYLAIYLAEIWLEYHPVCRVCNIQTLRWSTWELSLCTGIPDPNRTAPHLVHKLFEGRGPPLSLSLSLLGDSVMRLWVCEGSLTWVQGSRVCVQGTQVWQVRHGSGDFEPAEHGVGRPVSSGSTNIGGAHVEVSANPHVRRPEVDLQNSRSLRAAVFNLGGCAQTVHTPASAGTSCRAACINTLWSRHVRPDTNRVHRYSG